MYNFQPFPTVAYMASVTELSIYNNSYNFSALEAVGHAINLTEK